MQSQHFPVTLRLEYPGKHTVARISLWRHIFFCVSEAFCIQTWCWLWTMATHFHPSCVFSHLPALFGVLMRLLRELQQTSANFPSFLQLFRCVCVCVCVCVQMFAAMRQAKSTFSVVSLCLFFVLFHLSCVFAYSFVVLLFCQLYRIRNFIW